VPFTHSSAIRLLPKLATQLLPAVVVTIVGAAVLSQLAKEPDAAPAGTPVATAIEGEAIFRMTPRQPVEAAADDRPDATAPRAAAKPKAAAAAAPSPRKPAGEPQQSAALPPPLQIVQIPEPPQPSAAGDGTMMGKLRSATAAVRALPQRAGRSVASWFAAEEPPRPPAPVPVRNFQASM